MHDATNQFFKLAVAPGVPSPHLSKLFALQREEEPEISIAFSQVTGKDLVAGFCEGRYDAGLFLQGRGEAFVNTQPLWFENMAVAIPPQSPLLDRTELILTDLLEYPLYRWPEEVCPLLDRRLSFLSPVDQKSIRCVTSFEMLALWVAAGYGVGVTAQSRIEHMSGRESRISMRALADGPYEIVTHLLRRWGKGDSAAERFERRALRVAQSDSA